MVGAGGADAQVALDHAIALLATNTQSVLDPAVAVLTKLVGNVADKPHVAKYLTFKADNPKIAEALSAVGATEFMLACGWKRDPGTSSSFTIPEHAIVPGRLKAAQNCLGDVVAHAQTDGHSAAGGGGKSAYVDVPHGHFQCSACRRVVCNDDTIDFSGGGGLAQGLYSPHATLTR